MWILFSRVSCGNRLGCEISVEQKEEKWSGEDRGSFWCRHTITSETWVPSRLCFVNFQRKFWNGLTHHCSLTTAEGALSSIQRFTHGQTLFSFAEKKRTELWLADSSSLANRISFLEPLCRGLSFGSDPRVPCKHLVDWGWIWCKWKRCWIDWKVRLRQIHNAEASA